MGAFWSGKGCYGQTTRSGCHLQYVTPQQIFLTIIEGFVNHFIVRSSKGDYRSPPGPFLHPSLCISRTQQEAAFTHPKGLKMCLLSAAGKWWKQPECPLQEVSLLGRWQKEGALAGAIHRGSALPLVHGSAATLRRDSVLLSLSQVRSGSKEVRVEQRG